MRHNRFIGAFDLSGEQTQITDADTVHQIARVLRLGVGDTVVLGDRKGFEANATIAVVGKDSVEVTLGEKRKNENEPLRRVTLYLAILKRENFEYAAMKATEVGVAALVPVITARTVKTGLNTARIGKIMKEAAEQSGRGIVPELSDALSFEKALAHAKKNDANFFFHTAHAGAGEEKISTAPDLVPEKNLPASREDARVGIFIGPEGGWSNDEVVAARNAGCALASFGRLTLRAETAAVVATYLTTHPPHPKARPWA